MTIEKIDSERILIALCDEDMKSFSLEFESMTLTNPYVRETLKSLLSFASVETGISVYNKKMLIEAIPYKNGCLLLITLKAKEHKRKVYRIKEIRPLIFCFDDVESLLRCICELYKRHDRKIRSDAYKLFDKYILTIRPYSRVSQYYTDIIGEFGERISGGALTFSRICEYGNVIVKDNAVEIIGSSISGSRKVK